MELDERELKWLTRARQDFPYFCRSLKIRIKDDRGEEADVSTVGAFIWRPAQWIVWYWMCDQINRGVPIYLVILKARQFGISTFFCAWLFWQMWRSMDVRCLFSVKSKGTTMNAFMDTLNRFYLSLPEGYRPELRAAGAKRLSANEVYFNDRHSGGYCVAADIEDSARGDAYDHALCTEVGSYTRASEFFNEFTPAMGHRRNTTLILESTAAPGYFRERYLRAKKDGNAMFLPWSVAPELYSRKLIVDHKGRKTVYRDFETTEIVEFSVEDRREIEFLSKEHEKINERIGRDLLKPVTLEQMWWWHWYCETKADGDEEWMRQEFPRDDKSAFEKSVVSAFKVCLPTVRVSTEDAPEAEFGTLECFDDIEDQTIENHDIRFVEASRVGRFWQEREPGLEIWAHPVPGYLYAVGVDVADDIGTVQDDDDAAYSVISVYCCNTRRQVAEWRGSMDPHALGDEVAKVGFYYNTALVCVEYNNMGITTIDRLTKYINYPNRFKWIIIDEAGRLHKRKEMWWTNDQNKQLMIGSFRNAVRSGYYIASSAGLYEEMMGYQNVDGHYEPGPGSFADRIVAAALSWQCVAADQDTEMMTLVFGSRFHEEPAKARDVAEGQAQKTVTRDDFNPFSTPARQLPAEFGPESEVQRIEDDDNWIYKGQILL